MALADIIARIEADAAAEAGELISAAEQAAEETLSLAREAAARESAVTVARGERSAASEADTLRASARLAARDEALAAKRAAIDAVLADAAAGIAALPDDKYVAWMAARIAAAARGGETVRIAPADESRLRAALPGALAALRGADAPAIDSAPADVASGVVLVGDRARVDLSVEALLDERRDELAVEVSRILFAEEKD